MHNNNVVNLKPGDLLLLTAKNKDFYKVWFKFLLVKMEPVFSLGLPDTLCLFLVVKTFNSQEKRTTMSLLLKDVKRLYNIEVLSSL